jgi:hypothetical protein
VSWSLSRLPGIDACIAGNLSQAALTQSSILKIVRCALRTMGARHAPVISIPSLPAMIECTLVVQLNAMLILILI